MRISKLPLVAALTSILTAPLSAQPVNSELQAKAVELLRQTLAQENPVAQPAMSPARSALPSTPAISATTARMAPGHPATPQQQQRAIELLRRTIMEQEAATPMQGAPRKAASTPNRHSTGKGAPAVQNAPRQPALELQAPSGTPTPDQPAGPRTKQQRLMDLLERYKADQMTPAEYHAERAKILAEP